MIHTQSMEERVDDLDEATERLFPLGASQPDFQPGADRWRVLLDPGRQPTCPDPCPAATP